MYQYIHVYIYTILNIMIFLFIKEVMNPNTCVNKPHLTKLKISILHNIVHVVGENILSKLYISN